MISLRSDITKRLLNYFFLNPQDTLYVNEIARKLNVDKRNLVKKLKELEKEGLLKNRYNGNMNQYSLNGEYPLYDEYRKIVLKTVGFEQRLRKIIEGIKGVKEALIYGSYARDKMDSHSDIDLLVVGSHSIIALQRELNKLQKEIKREINAVNIEEKDFRQKLKNKDQFITGILKGKKIRLI
jgi:predicted nucleotidyltransferase